MLLCCYVYVLVVAERPRRSTLASIRWASKDMAVARYYLLTSKIGFTAILNNLDDITKKLVLHQYCMMEDQADLEMGALWMRNCWPSDGQTPAHRLRLPKPILVPHPTLSHEPGNSNWTDKVFPLSWFLPITFKLSCKCLLKWRFQAFTNRYNRSELTAIHTL